MKKYMSAFIVSVLAPLSIAYGSSDTNRVQSRPTNTYKRVASTTQNSGNVTTNFYYNQAGRRKYGPEVSNRNYTNDSYTAKSYNETKTTKRSEYSQKKVVSQERKYFLAHPFFQPLKGRFGSVTDVGFAKNNMDIDLLNATVYDIDPTSASYYPVTETPIDSGIINVSGTAEAKQFTVKQDFSFGLTDQIAIIATGQYDSTKWKLKDWSRPNVAGDPNSNASDSGLNVFGFGLQARFLDMSDTIGMAILEYESQRETSDSLSAKVKLGYKFDRTTLYVMGSGGYSWLKNKNSNYGFYVGEESGDYFMLTYKQNIDDLFFANGGVGVFSVLNKYFTVNAEAIFGNYDWHNQLTAKAAFGVQPFDSFAFDIYASGVLYDSAEGKIKGYLNQDVNPVLYPATNKTYTIGDYKLKNYNEYKFGARLMLYF